MKIDRYLITVHFKPPITYFFPPKREYLEESFNSKVEAIKAVKGLEDETVERIILLDNVTGKEEVLFTVNY